MLMTCPGRHGARLTFDGTTVTIIRKGGGEKRFNVAAITAVQFREPQFFGRAYIEFTLPGAIERQRGHHDVGSRSYPDGNIFVFGKRQLGQATEIRNAIEGGDRPGARRASRALMRATDGAQSGGHPGPHNDEKAGRPPKGTARFSCSLASPCLASWPSSADVTSRR